MLLTYQHVGASIYMNERSYNKKENNMEEIIINKDIVNKVLNSMIDDEKIFELAEVFKLFGDSTRMKIFCALRESELCVYDIAYITKCTQSAISHQLKLLKDSNLIKSRKEGKVVYYSLDDDHVEEILKKGLDHIEEI